MAKLNRELTKFRNKIKPRRLAARVGWSDGTITDSTRPNYIRLHWPDGVQFEAWNDGAPLAFGADVDVIYDTDDPNLPGVFRAVTPRQVYTWQDYGYSVIKPHRLNHQWPNGDWVPVEMRQIMPLHPSVSGFTLSVRAGWVKTATSWEYYIGGSVSLTSNIPTTGARFILVAFTDAAALTIIEGDPVSLFDLGMDDVPDLPVGYTPIALIRLYAGQTAINDGGTGTSDLIDVRFTSSGGDASTAVWGNITGDVNDQTDIKNYLFDYLKLNTAYTPTGSEPTGTVYWNADEGTTDRVLPGGVILQDGQELFFNAKNQTGGTLANGTPVMFAGTLGASGRLLIQKAIADGSLPPEYTMGIVTEPIDNGEDGKVTWFGKVRGINTTGTPYGETWADGDLIYISPSTAGNLTKVAPNAPDRRILVAAVVYAHATAGVLFVRPSWTPNLDELDDVDGADPNATGDMLTYNAMTGTWERGTYNIADYVQKAGDTLDDGANLAFGTTTGTKLGTATSQKLGFWNATPIVQPTTAVAESTFVQNSGNAVNDDSTFDGYTLAQVVKALRNAGLLA